METVTLGDLSGALAFIAGILASGGAVYAFLHKQIGKVIQESLKPTNDKIDNISKELTATKLDNCKNYLVQAISDLEAGNPMDKVATERFWENYDQYVSMGGNSYIHTAVDKLRKEGKL